jgi:hypothetical protein
MTRPGLEGIEVLLIDGNNLLHRVSGSAEPGAQRTLIPKLRGAIPPTIATVLMLDGHADSGTSRFERVGKGFDIRHSGSMSADDAILRLINDYPAPDRAEITIVSDDRALADRARALGARTQRLAWLENLIDVPHKAAGIGAGAPLPMPRSTEEREPWRPGRGATRKHGNPRRGRGCSSH